MATGDQADFLGRLKAVLPGRWFPVSNPAPAVSATPILDALLSGFAAAWAQLWSLLAYIQLQTRIATATDSFLNMASGDYFGTALPRRTGETDAAFSARIRANLLPQAGTRAAVIAAVQRLTGTAPTVFEPANAGDTGGYGGGDALTWMGSAYNVAGGYGSLGLPFQFFVTAARPTAGGVPNVAGYGSPTSAYANGALTGLAAVISPYSVYSPGGGAVVPDAEIYATIAATSPVATIPWTRIE